MKISLIYHSLDPTVVNIYYICLIILSLMYTHTYAYPCIVYTQSTHIYYAQHIHNICTYIRTQYMHIHVYTLYIYRPV